MSWHLAPSLEVLRNEVNAKWPNRSKASDGTIGDANHSARLSDHNPNGRGSVNAIDITTKDISFNEILAAAKRNKSARYVIHNRKIYNRDIGNWAPRNYTGPNPHTAHVHVSIYQSKSAEDNKGTWGIKGTGKAPAPSKPKPSKPGTKAPAFPLPSGHWYGEESKNPKNHSGYYSKDRAGIKKFQQRLKDRGWKIGVDGYFGPQTKKVVGQFQAEKPGLTKDYAVGTKTWSAIWESPIT